MTILEQILAGLQQKFAGVDTAILTRIATKKAEGVTDETKVNSIVEGISFSDVFNSYGDFRAGNASKTAVSNYEKSGVLGVSGVSSDMRELEAAVAAGNPKAILAEKMYFYRIKKYIGAYAAALGGVDIILFTGGVGENQANCRSEVCEGLEFMGVKIDLEKNKVRGEEAIISADDSKVTVAVIPTDEELMIASDTLAILNK